MCDMGRAHDHDGFGFLVDTPEVRALIDETQRQMTAVTDDAERVEALKPAFAQLLAADGWLPERYTRSDETSRMGDGIGQYALYRAEDGSLCLFSLVVLLADRQAQRGLLSVRQAAWYKKEWPTFSDAIASVRRRLWKESLYYMSSAKADSQKIQQMLFERFTDALCYAA